MFVPILALMVIVVLVQIMGPEPVSLESAALAVVPSGPVQLAGQGRTTFTVTVRPRRTGPLLARIPCAIAGKNIRTNHR
jgi:hypothetical protein